MAYVPDGAISRFHELTPKAGLLYVYYCMRRNVDHGGTAWPSLSTIASELSIPKTSACELRKQLIDKGWLELVSGDLVHVVMGFESFGKVESHSGNSNAKTRTGFDIAERRSEKSNEIEGSRSEKSNEPFGKVESHNRKNQLIEPAYKKLHVESGDSTARSVETIFAYWQERLNHPNSKLTPERRRRVEARLRDGYSVEHIKQGIDGCASSPFNRGENSNGRAYDDLELICRNGSKLEGFIALAAPRNGATTPKRQFCSKCDHGYLPPSPGKSEARRCSCAQGREVSA